MNSLNWEAEKIPLSANNLNKQVASVENAETAIQEKISNFPNIYVDKANSDEDGVNLGSNYLKNNEVAGLYVSKAKRIEKVMGGEIREVTSAIASYPIQFNVSIFCSQLESFYEDNNIQNINRYIHLHHRDGGYYITLGLSSTHYPISSIEDFGIVIDFGGDAEPEIYWIYCYCYNDKVENIFCKTNGTYNNLSVGEARHLQENGSVEYCTEESTEIATTKYVKDIVEEITLSKNLTNGLSFTLHRKGNFCWGSLSFTTSSTAGSVDYFLRESIESEKKFVITQTVRLLNTRDLDLNLDWEPGANSGSRLKLTYYSGALNQDIIIKFYYFNNWAPY